VCAALSRQSPRQGSRLLQGSVPVEGCGARECHPVASAAACIARVARRLLSALCSLHLLCAVCISNTPLIVRRSASERRRHAESIYDTCRLKELLPAQHPL